MSNSTVYAQPREISNIEDCFFYHTMDIPGHGYIQGHWDLRPNIDKYLGKTNFKGKRVLEVGTANGYLCFHMEKQGADVVAFDLSEKHVADVVPFARFNYKQGEKDHQQMMRQLNNGYWFCHKAVQSQAKVVYGTTYAIPEEIGQVDISTFCAILLHLRDPFLAMQNAARLTRETLIVTEPLWKWSRLLTFFSLSKVYSGFAIFVPQAKQIEPKTTWWHLSPSVIKQFMAVLGFEETKVTYHTQLQGNKKIPFFTVIGNRTAPM